MRITTKQKGTIPALPHRSVHRSVAKHEILRIQRRQSPIYAHSKQRSVVSRLIFCLIPARKPFCLLCLGYRNMQSELCTQRGIAGTFFTSILPLPGSQAHQDIANYGLALTICLVIIRTPVGNQTLQEHCPTSSAEAPLL